MFCSDFFKVLCPILIEPYLFLAESVEPCYQLFDTPLKSALVRIVMFIARLDYLLVVISVPYLDLS